MTETPENQPELPMLYKSIRPLDAEKDGNLHVSPPTSFSFAESTNAIPLLSEEFALAASHYPIVFAAGDNPVPAAVVGLNNDINLFVSPDGQWVPGSYLPAYIRRYPFLLMDDPDQKQYVLCLDETSDILAEKGEHALFDGENPTSFTQNVMNFCASLRQQGETTDEFVSALKEYNLLMENNAELDMPDGSKLKLDGFQIIDPKKFDLLPDNIFLQWRRKGWIGLIYAHLLSSHRWQTLIMLHAMRQQYEQENS